MELPTVPAEMVIDVEFGTPSPSGSLYRRRHSSPPAVSLAKGPLCQFDPDPTAWFNLMNVEVPHIHRICHWCKDGIQETLSKVKEWMFPASQYKRQLNIAMERLQEVEAALNRAIQAQEIHRKKAEKECPTCAQRLLMSNRKPESMLGASCSSVCKTPETPRRPPRRTDNMRRASQAPQKVDNSCQTSPRLMPMAQSDMMVKPPAPPAARAPPPPPPPPPPVAPPPPPITKPPVFRVTRSSTKKKMEKQDSLPRITLQDLQNVKLRSSGRGRLPPVSSSKRRQSIAVFSQPAIQKDLHKAAMKRTLPISSNQEALALAMDRLPEEILHAHKKLKKIDLRRSPGGTPVVDKEKRRETGSGLTPMMTRALRRKFLLARSPEDKENDESFKPAKPEMFDNPESFV